MLVQLTKIQNFIDTHHVLSLATSNQEELSVCSLFYAYDKSNQIFVVASSEETTHIQHVLHNTQVAGTIVLETKQIGKIQGLQFRGKFTPLEGRGLSKIYFKAFPTALVMKPKLWQIQVEYFKMTDNTLGFGKKIIWEL